MQISLRNIRADARTHTFPHTQNYGLGRIHMSAVACTFGLYKRHYRFTPRTRARSHRRPIDFTVMLLMLLTTNNNRKTGSLEPNAKPDLLLVGDILYMSQWDIFVTPVSGHTGHMAWGGDSALPPSPLLGNWCADYANLVRWHCKQAQTAEPPCSS
jgi:hypothetical protein